MLHILGIRHHGPGSARSIYNALEQIQPDCILVEGPPDANANIAQISHVDFEPPVALLVHTPIQKDERPQSAFYPFAEFSPEWQALQFAIKQNIAVEFMDLPCMHRFALEKQWQDEREQAIAERAALAEESSEEDVSEEENTLNADDEINEAETLEHEAREAAYLKYQRIRQDPILVLAQQAGYTDSERFWEHLIEQQPHAGQMFAAINSVMAEVREYSESLLPQDAVLTSEQLLEQYREAYMRKIIRQAQKQGFENIVVICGAWHAPVLADLKSTSKDDTALLKGLPKNKIETAWIAWTHGRLSRASGYGAGVEAVGWYAHLWQHYQTALQGQVDTEKLTIDWLSKFAQALRQAGHDASSAQIIDAVHLIQSLLQLRGRHIPDLDDLFEVIQSVLHHGLELPQPVLNALLKDERLGKVPDELITLPLQQDFLKQVKHFRLKLEAPHKQISLDLREPFDLAKSQFLHQTKLLNVAWANLDDLNRSQGSFKEIWTLSWQPESSLYLNEMSIWGNSIYTATQYFLEDQVKNTQDIAQIAKLLEDVLLSGLDNSLSNTLQKLDELTSQNHNPHIILDTLKPLVSVLRYGSVRKIATEHLQQVIEHLSIRLMLSLPSYSLQLNAEMAQEFTPKLQLLHDLLQQLDQQELLDLWYQTLHKLLKQEQMQGYLHGYCVRLAKSLQLIEQAEVQQYLSRALSIGQTMEYSAAWFEGFLTGQALLLIHEQQLWQIVNSWIKQIPEQQFIDLLPILARTAASFEPAEAQQILQKVTHAERTHEQRPIENDLDLQRAHDVLLHLQQYLQPKQATDFAE